MTPPNDKSARRLVDNYDAVLFDLDGVLYVGEDPVPAAPATLRSLREGGVACRFITNNASRPRDEVAQRLATMKVLANPDEIVTSADVAAELLARELTAGSPVLVAGGPGVEHALRSVGLRPVSRADDRPAAVLQGWHPDVGWRLLAEAAVAIRQGATWVATNTDRTIPSPRGPLPGNGSLVAALSTATGETPRSVGKPGPAMYDKAASGAARPLAVGDRLDTDVEGARNAGLDSLLVLSGVSGPIDLLIAAPAQRPTHVGADISALLQPPRTPMQDSGGRWRCQDAVAEVIDGVLRVSGDAGSDGCDRIRAAAAAAWTVSDQGEPLDTAELRSLNL